LNKNLARRLRQVAIGVERLIRGALETTGDDDDAGPEPDWDKALRTGGTPAGARRDEMWKQTEKEED
jgi:hypothetical protein